MARPVQTRNGDFQISCTVGPLKSDYVAETQSGVPLTDPYAVDRGLGDGLVRLMDQDKRRVKNFTMARGSIRAFLRVALKTDSPDRLDLLFMTGGVTAIHTEAGNAGIFTGSDVYKLFYAGGAVAMGPLPRELRQMLAEGLKAYPPGSGCVPALPLSAP